MSTPRHLARAGPHEIQQALVAAVTQATGKVKAIAASRGVILSEDAVREMNGRARLEPRPADRKAEPVRPIALETEPHSEEERKLLRAACKAVARERTGKTGKQLEIETERIYQASLEEGRRRVKTVLPKLVAPASGILARRGSLIIKPGQN